MAGETLRAIQSSVDALLRRFEVAVARGQGSRERARDVYPASEIQSMITSLETAKGRLNAIYGGGGTTPVRINGDIDRALGELRLAAKMKDYRAQEVMYHIDNAAKYTLNVARALDSASIVRKTRSAKAAAVVAAAKAVGTKRELPPYNPPRFVQHGVGLSVRPVVSKLVVQIRASMQRGYVNIETAERLKDYLYSNSIDIPELGTASMIARDIYSTLAKQPGEQMKEVSESLNGYIQVRLQQIVKAIQAIS